MEVVKCRLEREVLPTQEVNRAHEDWGGRRPCLQLEAHCLYAFGPLQTRIFCPGQGTTIHCRLLEFCRFHRGTRNWISLSNLDSGPYNSSLSVGPLYPATLLFSAGLFPPLRTSPHPLLWLANFWFSFKTCSQHKLSSLSQLGPCTVTPGDLVILPQVKRD